MHRRTYLAGGGSLAATLLAGCAGSADDDTEESTPEETAQTEEPTPDETEAEAPRGHTASMAPVGEVAFDAVPEDVLVYSLLYADTAVALGHGDAVNSLGFDAATGGATLDAYYDRLDGVGFAYDDLTQLNTGSGNVDVSKELLYELDSDLHLADPALFVSFDGWDAADVDEIADNVAPWFGNAYSRQHSPAPEPYADDYEYYTLWEIVDRVADVFQERERFAALAGVYEDLLARVEANLPPADERPTVASVIFMDDTFYPSRIDTPGIANAHVRPLGARDAFAGEEIDFTTTYDYEAMLEFDPDVILHQFGIASYYDVDEIRTSLEANDVGAEIAAVANDRVYPSGDPVQGPLMNLFQLEMTAKQLYPERFGEWPGYAHGESYPQIPDDERLFDRERVAAIVTGEV